MRVKVEFNANNFVDRLQGTIGAIGFGSKRILLEDAEEIMEISKQLCPEDTGALINSAFVELTKDRISGAEVTYGYKGDTINPKTGEFSSEYAVKVHEDLEAYHPKGEAKFLEKAIMEYTSKFEVSLTKKLAQLFSR